MLKVALDIGLSRKKTEIENRLSFSIFKEFFTCMSGRQYRYNSRNNTRNMKGVIKKTKTGMKIKNHRKNFTEMEIYRIKRTLCQKTNSAQQNTRERKIRKRLINKNR